MFSQIIAGIFRGGEAEGKRAELSFSRTSTQAPVSHEDERMNLFNRFEKRNALEALNNAIVPEVRRRHLRCSGGQIPMT